MSFWSRSALRFWLPALLLAASGGAGAQQIYFQPSIQIGAEGDTNHNLVTSGDAFDKNQKRAVAGYDVDASGILGIATPTSDSLIKPEVAYSDFPSLHANDLRTSLDLNSQFRSTRGQGSILGRFDRESTYSSELASPQFNEIANPPNTPETGRISIDTTRTLYTVVPTYTFDLTQRLNWQITGTYQDVAYSGSNASGYIPFEYFQGGTSFGWAFDQRLSGSLGAFTSYEASRDQSGQVNAYGVALNIDYKLSTQFTNHLQISTERDDSRLRQPIVNTAAATTNVVGSTGLVRSLSTGTGATYSTTYVGQITKLELSVGRTYTPSGSGGTFAADQLQVEYQRDLSPRAQFLGAARYIDEKSVSAVFRSSDYSSINVTAGLKWKMTPTWFVTGGLQYVHEHFSSSGNASNGVVYVAVGYQGLGKRT